jgi:dimethylargininase
MFKSAIVRPPSLNFAQGISTAKLGKPILDIALEQHAVYCAALEKCGLNLTKLEPDPQFPDSTFVEDTAVLTHHSAILANPGVTSRRGEVLCIAQSLTEFYPLLHKIQAPGTLDGGDICQADDHFFIGISERTNEEGARQLSIILEQDGFSFSFVDIRGFEGLLHLKSGIAYLGDKQLVVTQGLEELIDPSGYEIVPVDKDETYATNCVRVNDYVILAAGYPKIAKELSKLGYKTIPMEMSEFQKMDGGLSCLSLRF